MAIVSKREILVIQSRIGSTEFMNEVTMNREYTMDEIITEAGDEAEIIGVLDCVADLDGGNKPVYRDITEQVAEYFIDLKRGYPRSMMPIYVRHSNAGAAYRDDARAA